MTSAFRVSHLTLTERMLQTVSVEPNTCHTKIQLPVHVNDVSPINAVMAACFKAISYSTRYESSNDSICEMWSDTIAQFMVSSDAYASQDLVRSSVSCRVCKNLPCAF